MARGWESKSVESQQTEPQPWEQKKPLTDAERATAHKREGLEMSRARIVRELETAEAETHRTALGNALKFLDEELKKLSTSA